MLSVNVSDAFVFLKSDLSDTGWFSSGGSNCSTDWPQLLFRHTMHAQNFLNSAMTFQKIFIHILLILNHQKSYFKDAKTFFRVVGRLDYIAGYNIVSPPLNLSIFCHPARNFIRSTNCSKSIVCATIYKV